MADRTNEEWEELDAAQVALPDECSPEEAEYIVTRNREFYPSVKYYRTEDDARAVLDYLIRFSRDDEVRYHFATIAKIIRTVKVDDSVYIQK
jgi:hypothetical protein